MHRRGETESETPTGRKKERPRGERETPEEREAYEEREKKSVETDWRFRLNGSRIFSDLTEPCSLSYQVYTLWRKTMKKKKREGRRRWDRKARSRGRRKEIEDTHPRETASSLVLKSMIKAVALETRTCMRLQKRHLQFL